MLNFSISDVKRQRFFGVLAFLFFSCCAAFAQTPRKPIESPKFQVNRYVVEGSDRLAQDEIDRALVSFTGEHVDFDTVQSALKALEKSLIISLSSLYINCIIYPYNLKLHRILFFP